MRKSIFIIIRVFALIMLVGGIILFFVCKYKAWESGIGYLTRDTSEVAMWNILSIQCIITAISSVFVFGFSYIVEAAVRYLNRCDDEDYQQYIESIKEQNNQNNNEES